jgi:hypothetical protein
MQTMSDASQDSLSEMIKEINMGEVRKTTGARPPLENAGA